MSKIDEIREKIEACFDPEEKEIALNLCDALDEATDYLEEWRRFYEEMGKHQQYDYSDKLKDIDQILERGREPKESEDKE